MNWREFKEAAPELASLAEKLFEQSGVVLIGTIRKDGSPRISPAEFIITDSRLYLGMMWRSLKALDLLRDPRCTVHSSISDRMAPDGEFKLHGRAMDVQDAEERRRYCQALYEKIGWNPEDMQFHLFSIDVQSAGFFTNEGNEARTMKRWRAGEQTRDFRCYVDGRMVEVE